MDSKLKR